MRQEIVQAIMVYQDELSADITRLVKEVVENFDFENEVRRIASQALAEGMRKAIRGDIERAAEGAWKEMRDLVMGSLLKNELSDG